MGSEISVSNDVVVIRRKGTFDENDFDCRNASIDDGDTLIMNCIEKNISNDSSSIASIYKTVNARDLSSDFETKKYKSSIIIDRIKCNASGFNLDRIDGNDKICFICCNSYEGSKYALGESALNDGIWAFINFEKLGYKVFLFHDMKKVDYVNVFKLFMNSNAQRIAVYYIGHGVQVKDINGDESDGMDEAIYSADGKTIVDDDLFVMIKNRKNKSNELVLISDCCHSGTIFDVPKDMNNVITISAAADSETAKQDWINKRGQGIFTYWFWELYPKIKDIQALKTRMNDKLKRYSQGMVTNRTDNPKDYL